MRFLTLRITAAAAKIPHILKYGSQKLAYREANTVALKRIHENVYKYLNRIKRKNKREREASYCLNDETDIICIYKSSMTFRPYLVVI